MIDRFGRRLGRLERMLGGLQARARLASARPAHGQSPGSFASRRPTSRGFEPASPRPFSIEDEPDRLEFGRLGAGFAVNPAWALYNGELRIKQATSHLESELVVVVDLSRSMLSGCRVPDDESELPASGKLEALYLAVAAFLSAGESAGFVLRVLYAQGDRVVQERSRTARDFRAGVLSTMSGSLIKTARSGLEDPGAPEPFSIAYGLSAARAVRMPGPVVVVSDFLDPLGPDEPCPGPARYTNMLADLLLRRDVVLVDVASRYDLAFPEPRWSDLECRRVPCPEGARHLELGIESRPLSAAAIRSWNDRRKSDRETLGRLVANNGRRLVSAQGWEYPRFHQLATAHLGSGR
jgi:hypothetical protein